MDRLTRIRGRDTGPELRVAEVMDRMGIGYERNVKGMPTAFDFVVHDMGLQVMVERLPAKWRAKIESNVRRDVRQRRMLRRSGWSVHRIWEGDTKDPAKAERRLLKVIKTSRDVRTRRGLTDYLGPY